MAQRNQVVTAVKYFTSRVSSSASDPGKAKRQATYLDALEARGGISIFYGNYQSKKILCHKCGHTYVKGEEKRTDVNIAVALLSDAFHDRFDTAVVVSGDSDLEPAISEVRNIGPGKRVVVAFPPKRSSEVLKKAANGYFKISESAIRGNQLQESIPAASGYIIHKPTRWN